LATLAASVTISMARGLSVDLSKSKIIMKLRTVGCGGGAGGAGGCFQAANRKPTANTVSSFLNISSPPWVRRPHIAAD
jgi:hypothetical protein